MNTLERIAALQARWAEPERCAPTMWSLLEDYEIATGNAKRGLFGVFLLRPPR